MFYNHQYFARRKGGLGIYWLAATVGSSSAFKKLSKKEIMDCNIPRAVDKLIHPEEPLALRLTSNLMFGVTRVYSYQCNYLHQNATTTSTSLKQAIIQLDIPKSRRDALTALTLTNEAVITSGKEKPATTKGALKTVRDGGVRITIARDEGLDLLADFGELFDGGMAYTWEALREQLNNTTAGEKRKRTLQAEDSYLDELDPLDGDDYIEAGPSKKAKKEKNAKETAPVASRRSTTIGRPQDINLPAHLMDGHHIRDDLRDDQLIFGEDRDFDPMFDLDPDFDLGLADLPPPLADFDDNIARRGPRASSLTVAGELNAYDAGASGGPDTSATGAGAFEAGLDDDVFAGADQYELGLDIYDPPQGDFFPGADVVQEINERVQQDVMGREEKYSNSEEAGVEAAGPPTPPPSDGPRQDPDNSVEDNNNNGKSNKIASKKPKSRRSQQPVRDRFTTLKAEEVLKNRAAYSDEMKKFNLVKDLERFEKGQKELLLDMMTALPSGGGPAFRSNQIFSEALNLNDVLRLTDKEKKALGKDAAKKRGSTTLRNPSLPDEDRSVTTRARGGREGSVLSSQMGRNGYRDGRQSDYGFNDGFDMNMDNEFFDGVQRDDYQYDGPGNDQPETDWQNEDERQPSVARSFSLGPRGERGSSVHAEESNIGRERAASLSYGHGSQMPWNASYSSATALVNAPSSSARYSMGRGSVPPTPGGPRSRSSSILGNSFLRGRAASRADSPFFQGDNQSIYERGRTPSRAETPGKHRDSPAPSVSVRGRETSAAIPEHVFSDSQIGETESQIEVRLEAESRNFYRFAKGFAQAPNNEFLLSDIIPVAPTAPIVAAQAFYHTLMLASKGLLKVHQQEEAYGEIRLSIPNALASSQSQSPVVAT